MILIESYFLRKKRERKDNSNLNIKIKLFFKLLCFKKYSLKLLYILNTYERPKRMPNRPE